MREAEEPPSTRHQADVRQPEPRTDERVQLAPHGPRMRPHPRRGRFAGPLQHRVRGVGETPERPPALAQQGRRVAHQVLRLMDRGRHQESGAQAGNGNARRRTGSPPRPGGERPGPSGGRRPGSAGTPASSRRPGRARRRRSGRARPNARTSVPTRSPPSATTPHPARRRALLGRHGSLEVVTDGGSRWTQQRSAALLRWADAPAPTHSRVLVRVGLAETWCREPRGADDHRLSLPDDLRRQPRGISRRLTCPWRSSARRCTWLRAVGATHEHDRDHGRDRSLPGGRRAPP